MKISYCALIVAAGVLLSSQSKAQSTAQLTVNNNCDHKLSITAVGHGGKGCGSIPTFSVDSKSSKKLDYGSNCLVHIWSPDAKLGCKDVIGTGTVTFQVNPGNPACICTIDDPNSSQPTK